MEHNKENDDVSRPSRIEADANPGTGQRMRSDEETTVSNAVYYACCAQFEGLEHAGLIWGNGHHMAQRVGEFAVGLLQSRWRDKPGSSAVACEQESVPDGVVGTGERRPWTPGPWDRFQCRVGTDEGQLASIAAPEGWRAQRDDKRWLTVAEANACLISAAPDLYEALAEAVTCFGCMLAQRDSGHLVDCFVPRAKAALAKALGDPKPPENSAIRLGRETEGEVLQREAEQR